MSTKSKMCGLFAGMLLSAAAILPVQASTLVTFSVDMGTNILNGTFIPGSDTISAHGTFDGWGAGVNLVQAGGGTVYTNTANNTTDADGAVMSYKFVNSHTGLPNGGYEDTADFNNRAALLPSAGGTLVLPTPFYGDAGAHITNAVTFQVDMAQQINLGVFTAGSSIIEVRGNFNGWSGVVGNLTADPSIFRTNQFGLVTSNVYAGTFDVNASPNAAMDYKFVEDNNYEGTPLLADSGNNRFFSMPDTVQSQPVVFYNDAPYAPIVSNINFSVDMSVVVLTDTNFNPASLTVNGELMGWGGVAMTNDPAAANTNIYTSIQTYAGGVGSRPQYQFRYTHLSDGATVYDHLNGANGGNDNRVYQVADVPSTNVLSVFNDASLNDYLTQPTAVFFSVDMTGAVGTDSHVFNPGSDTVYINGQFANWYAWAGGINPASAPPGYQMVEQGLSMIYTNTLIFPAGTPVSFAYKYGMDPNALNMGPADDEAPSGQNHYRVVRSTATTPYQMPGDKFGYQYGEPFFNSGNTAGGRLSVGTPAGGSLPVTWLGRPGAQLQVSANLGGSWQTIAATDGTNWTAGYSSTNGFVSQTNWPASGNTFFRLVKP